MIFLSSCLIPLGLFVALSVLCGFAITWFLTSESTSGFRFIYDEINEIFVGAAVFLLGSLTSKFFIGKNAVIHIEEMPLNNEIPLLAPENRNPTVENAVSVLDSIHNSRMEDLEPEENIHQPTWMYSAKMNRKRNNTFLNTYSSDGELVEGAATLTPPRVKQHTLEESKKNKFNSDSSSARLKQSCSDSKVSSCNSSTAADTPEQQSHINVDNVDEVNLDFMCEGRFEGGEITHKNTDSQLWLKQTHFPAPSTLLGKKVSNQTHNENLTNRKENFDFQEVDWKTTKKLGSCWE